MGAPQRIFWSPEQDSDLRMLWTNKVTYPQMEKILGISKTSISRRVQFLKLERRIGFTGRKQPFRTIPIPQHCHPLYRRLIMVMNEQKVSRRDLSKTSGISREAIGAWGLDTSPTLVSIEACFIALGRKLVDVSLLGEA